MLKNIVDSVIFFDAAGQETDNYGNAVRYEGNINGGRIRGSVSDIDRIGEQIRIGTGYYRFVMKNLKLQAKAITKHRFGNGGMKTMISTSIEWAKSHLRYGQRVILQATDESGYPIEDDIIEIRGNYIIGNNSVYNIS